MADLLFMSSRNEGMPVVILEAAFRGIPTITTDVGGVREFVSNDQTGWLTEQTASATAELIESLIENDRVKMVGMQARKLAQEEFSLEKMTSNHLSLYRSLAKVTR